MARVNPRQGHADCRRPEKKVDCSQTQEGPAIDRKAALAPDATAAGCIGRSRADSAVLVVPLFELRNSLEHRELLGTKALRDGSHPRDVR